MSQYKTKDPEKERFKDQFKDRINNYLDYKRMSAYMVEQQADLGAKSIYNASIGNSLPQLDTLHKLKKWDPFCNLNYLVADSGPMIMEGKEYPSPPELQRLVEESNDYKTKYIKSFETIQDLREENERQRLKIKRLETELDKLKKSKEKARKH